MATHSGEYKSTRKARIPLLKCPLTTAVMLYETYKIRDITICHIADIIYTNPTNVADEACLASP